MTIAVIDGVGGGIGAQVVERLRRESLSSVRILALGTNAVATQRMVDAGAEKGASGENAIKISVRSVDYIVGPIGIVLPNAMMGEVTAGIAEAVLGAPGPKLLLPLSQPHVTIVGMAPRNMNDLIGDAIAALRGMLAKAETNRTVRQTDD